MTGRPRDLARVGKASSARPRRVQYSFLRMSIYSFLLQHDRCCRRRHQRHGRIQERSGPEMYTVSCVTSSLLPLPRAPSSHRVGRQMFAKYYFNNPTHVTLPQSSKASCLGIVSLEAHSKVAAAALCLCFSPGNDGVHMVHPIYRHLESLKLVFEK